MLGWRGKEARGRAPQPQPRPPAGSLWTRVASWLAPGQQQPGPADAATEARLSAEDDPDAVHIFTIASGHMYERLQKIMILSVLRNTRRAPARVYPPCPNPNPLACPSRLLAALPPSPPCKPQVRAPAEGHDFVGAAKTQRAPARGSPLPARGAGPWLLFHRSDARRGRARDWRSRAKAGTPRTRQASNMPDCRLEIVNDAARERRRRLPAGRPRAQGAREVLVHQELHVAAVQALPAAHGRAVRLRVRAGHVQVAVLAAQAGTRAEGLVRVMAVQCGVRLGALAGERAGAGRLTAPARASGADGEAALHLGTRSCS